MRTVLLGPTDRRVPNVVLGLMRIAQMNDDEVDLLARRHPANMQVVLGTTTPQRVTDAAQGSDIALTRAEWYTLFRAAGYRVP